MFFIIFIFSFDSYNCQHTHDPKGIGVSATRKNMKKSINTDEFIRRSVIKHSHKYCYDKSVYTNYDSTVEISCPTHGSFMQRAGLHMNGSGCPMCKGVARLTTSEFIKKAKIIHGDKYLYHKTNYVCAKKKVIITCKTHGDFEQTSNNHLHCQKGCDKCGGSMTLTTDEFVSRSKKIHKNKYDYSKTEYTSTNSKVTIICPKHGEFKQSASDHMNGKKGCKKCSWKISKPEMEFLSHVKVDIIDYKIPSWRNKNVDGYDSKTNTIYEFLGDYWHGNDSKYNQNAIHPSRKITYGDLKKLTFNNLNKLKSLGYIVKYIWETDWNDFKNEKVTTPRIVTL